MTSPKNEDFFSSAWSDGKTKSSKRYNEKSLGDVDPAKDIVYDYLINDQLTFDK